MTLGRMRGGIAGLILLATAGSAGAQLSQSQSYRFLEAVRNGKGAELNDILNTPGTTIVNTRDPSSGEGALHIVTRKGDMTYLRFLLQHGADPNMRNRDGVTPLMMAVNAGEPQAVQVLIANKADVNLANNSGETPLIRAVQKRDVELVRTLLDAGADPDQTDNLAGMSARDYAHSDVRSPALANILEEAPKKTRRAVAGPHL